MNVGTRAGLALAGILLAAPALAQQRTPSYTADQLTQLLGPSAKPSFTADQFQEILAPAIPTRSLTPGTVAPGEPGSGVVPDLKINFGFNSTELTPASRATLDELAKAMKSEELGGLRFEIAGHTDAKGSERYNEELSRKRAAAVASYLEKKAGMSPDRLDAKGYGERELWDRTNPENPMNCRVEVRVES